MRTHFWKNKKGETQFHEKKKKSQGDYPGWLYYSRQANKVKLETQEESGLVRRRVNHEIEINLEGWDVWRFTRKISGFGDLISLGSCWWRSVFIYYSHSYHIKVAKNSNHRQRKLEIMVDFIVEWDIYSFNIFPIFPFLSISFYLFFFRFRGAILRVSTRPDFCRYTLLLLLSKEIKQTSKWSNTK